MDGSIGKNERYTQLYTVSEDDEDKYYRKKSSNDDVASVDGRLREQSKIAYLPSKLRSAHKDESKLYLFKIKGYSVQPTEAKIDTFVEPVLEPIQCSDSEDEDSSDLEDDMLSENDNTDPDAYIARIERKRKELNEPTQALEKYKNTMYIIKTDKQAKPEVHEDLEEQGEPVPEQNVKSTQTSVSNHLNEPISIKQDVTDDKTLVSKESTVRGQLDVKATQTSFSSGNLDESTSRKDQKTSDDKITTDSQLKDEELVKTSFLSDNLDEATTTNQEVSDDKTLLPTESGILSEKEVKQTQTSFLSDDPITEQISNIQEIKDGKTLAPTESQYKTQQDVKSTQTSFLSDNMDEPIITKLEPSTAIAREVKATQTLFPSENLDELTLKNQETSYDQTLVPTESKIRGKQDVKATQTCDQPMSSELETVGDATLASIKEDEYTIKSDTKIILGPASEGVPENIYGGSEITISSERWKHDNPTGEEISLTNVIKRDMSVDEGGTVASVPLERIVESSIPTEEELEKEDEISIPSDWKSDVLDTSAVPIKKEVKSDETEPIHHRFPCNRCNNNKKCIPVSLPADRQSMKAQGARKSVCGPSTSKMQQIADKVSVIPTEKETKKEDRTNQLRFSCKPCNVRRQRCTSVSLPANRQTIKAQNTRRYVCGPLTCNEQQIANEVSVIPTEKETERKDQSNQLWLPCKPCNVRRNRGVAPTKNESERQSGKYIKGGPWKRCVGKETDTTVFKPANWESMRDQDTGKDNKREQLISKNKERDNILKQTDKNPKGDIGKSTKIRPPCRCGKVSQTFPTVDQSKSKSHGIVHFGPLSGQTFHSVSNSTLDLLRHVVAAAEEFLGTETKPTQTEPVIKGNLVDKAMDTIATNRPDEQRMLEQEVRKSIGVQTISKQLQWADGVILKPTDKELGKEVIKSIATNISRDDHNQSKPHAEVSCGPLSEDNFNKGSHITITTVELLKHILASGEQFLGTETKTAQTEHVVDKAMNTIVPNTAEEQTTREQQTRERGTAVSIAARSCIGSPSISKQQQTADGVSLVPPIKELREVDIQSIPSELPTQSKLMHQKRGTTVSIAEERQSYRQQDARKSVNGQSMVPTGEEIGKIDMQSIQSEFSGKHSELAYKERGAVLSVPVGERVRQQDITKSGGIQSYSNQQSKLIYKDAAISTAEASTIQSDTRRSVNKNIPSGDQDQSKLQQKASYGPLSEQNFNRGSHMTITTLELLNHVVATGEQFLGTETKATQIEQINKRSFYVDKGMETSVSSRPEAQNKGAQGTKASVDGRSISKQLQAADGGSLAQNQNEERKEDMKSITSKAIGRQNIIVSKERGISVPIPAGRESLREGDSRQFVDGDSISKHYQTADAVFGRQSEVVYKDRGTEVSIAVGRQSVMEQETRKCACCQSGVPFVPTENELKKANMKSIPCWSTDRQSEVVSKERGTTVSIETAEQSMKAQDVRRSVVGQSVSKQQQTTDGVYLVQAQKELRKADMKSVESSTPGRQSALVYKEKDIATLSATGEQSMRAQDARKYVGGRSISKRLQTADGGSLVPNQNELRKQGMKSTPTESTDRQNQIVSKERGISVSIEAGRDILRQGDVRKSVNGESISKYQTADAVVDALVPMEKGLGQKDIKSVAAESPGRQSEIVYKERGTSISISAGGQSMIEQERRKCACCQSEEVKTGNMKCISCWSTDRQSEVVSNEKGIAVSVGIGEQSMRAQDARKSVGGQSISKQQQTTNGVSMVPTKKELRKADMEYIPSRSPGRQIVRVDQQTAASIEAGEQSMRQKDTENAVGGDSIARRQNRSDGVSVRLSERELERHERKSIEFGPTSIQSELVYKRRVSVLNPVDGPFIRELDTNKYLGNQYISKKQKMENGMSLVPTNKILEEEDMSPISFGSNCIEIDIIYKRMFTVVLRSPGQKSLGDQHARISPVGQSVSEKPQTKHYVCVKPTEKDLRSDVGKSIQIQSPCQCSKVGDTVTDKTQMKTNTKLETMDNDNVKKSIGNQSKAYRKVNFRPLPDENLHGGSGLSLERFKDNTSSIYLSGNEIPFGLNKVDSDGTILTLDCLEDAIIAGEETLSYSRTLLLDDTNNLLETTRRTSQMNVQYPNPHLSIFITISNFEKHEREYSRSILARDYHEWEKQSTDTSTKDISTKHIPLQEWHIENKRRKRESIENKLVLNRKDIIINQGFLMVTVESTRRNITVNKIKRT